MTEVRKFKVSIPFSLVVGFDIAEVEAGLDEIKVKNELDDGLLACEQRK